MKTKVLIHAVGASAGGGVRHLSNLVFALLEIDNDWEYEILIRESLPFEIENERFCISRIPDAKASGLISRLYLDIFKIPWLAKIRGYSCVISLMNFGPVFISCPHILYQCNLLYFSDFKDPESSPGQLLKFYLRRLVAVAGMSQAQAIVVPSKSTRDEIFAKIPSLRARKFEVIYHGFDVAKYEEPLGSELLEMLDKKIGFDFFYPAHLLSHKAHETLILIANELKMKIKFRLLLTLSRSENPEKFDDIKKLISSLNLESNVILIGNVPQSQIGNLYKRCDLMIFSSVVESFGLPLLEAMAYECPIVASDTEIHREICGDAALFYAPNDPVDGAEKVMLSLESSMREKMLLAGKERLSGRDWSWNSNARSLLKVVDEIRIRRPEYSSD